MRTLTYYVAATLDGFIAGPEGGDPSGEDYMAVTPDLVEFIATHYPETLPGPAREAMGLTEPGRVFDLSLPLAQVADAYTAMDQRTAIKVILEP